MCDVWLLSAVSNSTIGIRHKDKFITVSEPNPDDYNKLFFIALIYIISAG